MCVHGLERQVLSKAFSLLLPPFLYHTHPEAAAAAKQALLQVACNPAAEAADASLPWPSTFKTMMATAVMINNSQPRNDLAKLP